MDFKKQHKTSINEVFYDFALREYRPIKNYKDKLKISNLLYFSLLKSKNKDYLENLVEELINFLGENQTIWALKNRGGEISWEIYFYRHFQKNLVCFDNLKKILSKYFVIKNFTINKNSPYIIFSFDLGKDNVINAVNVYYGSFVGTKYQSWSYKISENKKEFENHYELFAADELAAVVRKIKSSPFYDGIMKPKNIIFPQFLKCNSIWVANKRSSCSIYFGGININQFLFFLKKFNYQKSLINYTVKNRKYFDYVLFDVSYDFSIENNKINFSKSSFFGTF